MNELGFYIAIGLATCGAWICLGLYLVANAIRAHKTVISNTHYCDEMTIGRPEHLHINHKHCATERREDV